MHESLHSDIKMHTDRFFVENVKICMAGWVASSKLAIVSLVLQSGSRTLGTVRYNIPRPDVFDFYGRNAMAFLNCGFEFEFSVASVNELPKQLSLYANLASGVQVLIKEYQVPAPLILSSTSYSGKVPSFSIRPDACAEFLVVDDFYQDVDIIRQFALNADFKASPSYHKGERSQTRFCPDQIKTTFERLMGKRITKWDYEHNGVFQFCLAQDSLVYHMDHQKYAAVVFLTPDAPPEAGTSFFRSRKTGLRAAPTDADVRRLKAQNKEELLKSSFPNGFYDKTQLELIDCVGNVYNRMVLWNAQLIHAANQYFGQTKETGRLFHMFFFDAE